MPISLDLDHITGRFRSIGAFQLTPIAYIFQRLGNWLDDRVKKADELDESSRGFPVIWIDGDAVLCWVDQIQWGALSPDGSPPGFGDQMRAAGAAFVNGLGRIPEAIQSELVIPRFLATINAGIQAILDSVIRFETPTAETFDPRRRTASDLFGEAALGFRALTSSKGQILTFLFGQAAPAYFIFKGAGGGSEPSRNDPKSTTDLLEWISRYVVGALLILPYLPELLARLWESANLAIKSKTLDMLAQKEEKVFELRRTIIDLFYVRMRNLIQTALSYTHAAGMIIISQASFWSAFLHLYGLRLLLDVRQIGDDIADYIFKVAVWIKDKFLTRFDGILKFDLAPYFMIIFGGLSGWVLSRIKRPPPFTVLDLIHSAARAALLAWIAETMALLGLVGPITMPIQMRLIMLAKVVNGVFSPVGSPLEETAWPSVPAHFPSIFDEWLKASKASDIKKKFIDMATQVPAQLSDLLDTAAGAVEQAGYRFDDLAAASARGGSLQEYLSLSARAADLAQQAFGPEAEALKGKLSQDKEDVVAQSFESWFALGGFQTLSLFLEHYIGGMLDWFRQKESTGDELTVLITKTSPQILAKKAALGRAVMQRLTLDARGRALDGGLVQEIADSFRNAISDAYMTGRRQIEEVATMVAV